MEKITFDQLPDAVSSILDKLERIEKQLLEQSHMKESDSDKMLTYSDITKEFKISRQALSELKNKGELIASCKGGRCLLFKRSHVIEVLQNRIREKPKFLG